MWRSQEEHSRKVGDKVRAGARSFCHVAPITGARWGIGSLWHKASGSYSHCGEFGGRIVEEHECCASAAWDKQVQYFNKCIELDKTFFFLCGCNKEAQRQCMTQFECISLQLERSEMRCVSYRGASLGPSLVSQGLVARCIIFSC